jgi:hypothetical protein
LDIKYEKFADLKVLIKIHCRWLFILAFEHLIPKVLYGLILNKHGFDEEYILP